MFPAFEAGGPSPTEQVLRVVCWILHKGIVSRKPNDKQRTFVVCRVARKVDARCTTQYAARVKGLSANSNGECCCCHVECRGMPLIEFYKAEKVLPTKLLPSLKDKKLDFDTVSPCMLVA